MLFRSLEFRLTLMVTLVCSVILCLVGVLTYWGIDRILIREQDQALQARIERLEVLLQDSSNIEQIIQRPKIYQNMLGNQDNLFILIREQTHLININPLNIHVPKLPPQDEIHFLNLHQSAYSTRIAWKNFEIAGQRYQLIAGKQWSERLGILYSFANDLMYYFGFGLIVLCLLCWLVCRLGLSGLRQLTRRTQQIDIQSLQQGITVSRQSSEITQLTDAINLMLKRIEESYQQLNRFSENIAHEFRTPLNNLIGQTEILLLEARPAQSYQDLLVSHLDEYQRLKRMINSMLFLARADQRQIQLNLQTIELSEFTENLLSFYELMASEKQMQIISNLEKVTLKVDADLLQRALGNLIENAIMHGDEHGIIQVSLSAHDDLHPDMIRLGVLSVDHFIEQTHLPHLFERFYQCQGSRHQQGRSGGLGLSIVASIMQLHAGRYAVENTAEGVCFYLYFPSQ